MPAIRAVVAAAFAAADEPGAGRRPGLIDALRAVRRLAAGAVGGRRSADGEVVAHALLSRVTVEPGGVRGARRSARWPCGRRTRTPAYGTAVVRAALDAARDRGETLVVVLGEPGVLPPLRLRAVRRSGCTAPWSGSDGLAGAGPSTEAGAGIDRLVRYPSPGSAYSGWVRR